MLIEFLPHHFTHALRLRHEEGCIIINLWRAEMIMSLQNIVIFGGFYKPIMLQKMLT